MLHLIYSLVARFEMPSVGNSVAERKRRNIRKLPFLVPSGNLNVLIAVICEFRMPDLRLVALFCIYLCLKCVIFYKARKRRLVKLALVAQYIAVAYRYPISALSAKRQKTDACLILSYVKERFFALLCHFYGGIFLSYNYRFKLK